MRESYITYWIDNKGNDRKTCGLAIDEAEAGEIVKLIYNDFHKLSYSEKGTIPFSFNHRK